MVESHTLHPVSDLAEHAPTHLHPDEAVERDLALCHQIGGRAFVIPNEIDTDAAFFTWQCH